MTTNTPKQQIEAVLPTLDPNASITKRVFDRALGFADADGNLDVQQTLLAALEGVAALENTLLRAFGPKA